MTRNEYIRALRQLPEDLKKKHGLKEPFDFTPYQCIHTDKYDYYPELNCCIINRVPIQWTNSEINVNPENPEHYAFMKSISDSRQQVDYVIIYVSDKDQTLDCNLYVRTNMFNTEQKFKEKGFKTMPFENKLIYYDPNKINLANDPTTLLLAKCIITALMYNTQFIIPEQNKPAYEWTLADVKE